MNFRARQGCRIKMTSKFFYLKLQTKRDQPFLSQSQLQMEKLEQRAKRTEQAFSSQSCLSFIYKAGLSTKDQHSHRASGEITHCFRPSVSAPTLSGGINRCWTHRRRQLFFIPQGALGRCKEVDGSNTLFRTRNGKISFSKICLQLYFLLYLFIKINTQRKCRRMSMISEGSLLFIYFYN